jgi:hypothetical protein
LAGVAPGTVEPSLVAVVVVPEPGTEGPDRPPPVTDPVLPELLPPGSVTVGSWGSWTPPELPLDPLPPLLLPPPLEPPVGRGSFGTEGSGTVTPPELPDEDLVGVGTTEVTVFWTHLPVLLRIWPTGHRVRLEADPAEMTPLSETASAPAVTKPARRTVVLGDIREKPPRRSGVTFWSGPCCAGPKA